MIHWVGERKDVGVKPDGQVSAALPSVGCRVRGASSVLTAVEIFAGHCDHGDTGQEGLCERLSGQTLVCAVVLDSGESVCPPLWRPLCLPEDHLLREAP